MSSSNAPYQASSFQSQRSEVTVGFIEILYVALRFVASFEERGMARSVRSRARPAPGELVHRNSLARSDIVNLAGIAKRIEAIWTHKSRRIFRVRREMLMRNAPCRNRWIPSSAAVYSIHPETGFRSPVPPSGQAAGS